MMDEIREILIDHNLPAKLLESAATQLLALQERAVEAFAEKLKAADDRVYRQDNCGHGELIDQALATYKGDTK